MEAVVNDVMGNRIEGVDDITWTELKLSASGEQKQLRAREEVAKRGGEGEGGGP